ncbi:N-acetylneuraminate lyase-like [Dendronephthya gigantea]|uniref:N-acetylneuraminate lyase-like n=1 Tax=Dendronephthya gigantea TaxID=151771 RepID=UPI00106C4A7D|nr:N-acetylneuraminate lyase-like [Dendronephthya gigantea]
MLRSCRLAVKKASQIRVYSKMNFQLGLAAAPVTPLDKNGELNLSLIGRYVDFLLEQGVPSVYVNGCTGEGPSFNVQERKLIAEKWVEEGRNKLDKIIIQVGGTNMKDSQELARHASSIGASAIASLPHLFFKSDMASLVDYCAELTSVVPDMPFMYYHIPGYTGVNINIEKFLEAAQHRLPSLIGLKYSHNDLFDATRSTLVAGGKYLVSLGADDLFLSGLVLGINSATGSTYNYCGKLNVAIMEAYKNQDMAEAMKLQHKALEYLWIFNKHGGNIAVTRAFLILLGLDVGPPRLPNKPLSDTDLQSLKNDLQNAGFFDSK